MLNLSVDKCIKTCYKQGEKDNLFAMNIWYQFPGCLYLRGLFVNLSIHLKLQTASTRDLVPVSNSTWRSSSGLSMNLTILPTLWYVSTHMQRKINVKVTWELLRPCQDTEIAALVPGETLAYTRVLDTWALLIFCPLRVTYVAGSSFPNLFFPECAFYFSSSC